MFLRAHLSYPFVVDIPLQCCRRLWSGRSTVYIQYITYFVAESSFSSTIMDGHCLTVTIVFQDWFGIGKVKHLCEVKTSEQIYGMIFFPKYWIKYSASYYNLVYIYLNSPSCANRFKPWALRACLTSIPAWGLERHIP